MTVTFTQFLRPYGRQAEVTTTLPDACKEQVDLVLRLGCRFTIEELSTGMVSAAIEHPIYGDYAMSLTPNGSDVPAGIEQMIMDFKLDEFHTWKAEQE